MSVEVALCAIFQYAFCSDQIFTRFAASRATSPYGYQHRRRIDVLNMDPLLLGVPLLFVQPLTNDFVVIVAR